MKVKRFVPNHLTTLLEFKSKIESTSDFSTKHNLAFKGIQLIYPIWHYYNPKDNIIVKCIITIQKYLDTKSNKEELEELRRNLRTINSVSISYYIVKTFLNILNYITHPHAYPFGPINSVDSAILITKRHFKL